MQCYAARVRPRRDTKHFIVCAMPLRTRYISTGIATKTYDYHNNAERSWITTSDYSFLNTLEVNNQNELLLINSQLFAWIIENNVYRAFKRYAITLQKIYGLSKSQQTSFFANFHDKRTAIKATGNGNCSERNDCVAYF